MGRRVKAAFMADDRMGHLPESVRAHWDNEAAIRAYTALEEIYFRIWESGTDKEKLDWIFDRCIKACHGSPWEVGS